MIVHLVDGTYELFRQFYGRRRANEGKDVPFGAVRGVLHSVLEMIEQGATHVGVATDHVIESFRNRLWSDYKTGEGVEPALLAQFHPLEEALTVLGVVVLPVIELDADDALASAAWIASQDDRVQQVCIWTPDKDLAQCVRGDRVVQVDRKAHKIRNAAAVRDKFGVEPGLIPDFLALVGDSADGYPGVPGIGAVTAARLLNQHGVMEHFPPTVLGEHRDRALLFKQLEALGGLFLLVGLFTRPVAFLLAGEMAVAYFIGHGSHGFWTVLNQGTPAVIYCFVWLYISAAGAGPWSLDAKRGR